MGKSLHTFIAGLVLMMSVAQAGLFPVLPGEQLFPFSGQNAIIPDYLPIEQPGVIDMEGVTGSGSGNFFVLTCRILAGFSPDWLSHQDLLSRIQFPEVRSLQYRSLLKALVPGLETFQIIFPFHSFW